MSKSKSLPRIPSLDGLRALSIGLVVFAHLIGTKYFFLAAAREELLGNICGNLGVRVFFVISGFLITTLLLEEFGSAGGISLKKFYARRMLRIFPAFYAFLLALLLLAGFHFIQLMPYDAIQSGTYTVNYFPWYTQSHFVRHIWSLSVEEQFYMLWPTLLFLAGVRRGMILAGSLLVFEPLIRLAYWLWMPSIQLTLDRRFDAVADVLATGCLLAGLQAWLSGNARYLRFLKSRLFLLVPVLTIAASATMPRPRIYYGVGQTIMNIGIALCLDRCVRFPRDVVGVLLNSAPLRLVGVLSYSIYIWQQLFLEPGSDKWWTAFPVNVLLTAAFSAASYYWLETPFLRLKKRFSAARLHHAEEIRVA